MSPPIDVETQAALDALTATMAQHRAQALSAIQADRSRLDAAEVVLGLQATRFDTAAERMDELVEGGRRLRRALREGRFDDEGGTFVDALGAALGMSVSDLRAALVWLAQERRKARR